MKRKQFVRLLTIMLVAFLVLGGFYQKGNGTVGHTQGDGAVYEAGTYTGVSEGHGGELKVEVTFNESTIESVEVIQHNESAGISDAPLDRLPGLIVETQSLGMDVVSGASLTSLAIIAAVEDAVLQAGGDLSALKSSGEANSDELKEVEMHTDVVVIGGGGAGLAVALSAEQHGVEVVLLEKLASLGGSTRLSGGGISATGTRFQKELGIEDSKEAWMELWVERQETSNPDSQYPDYDVLSKFMDEAVITTEWMVDYVGHSYGNIMGFGLDPVERIHFPVSKEGVGGGTILIDNMVAALEDKNIEVLMETEAIELLTDENGEVIGVVAEGEDYRTTVYADQVIIAAGGFAKNEELLKRFIPEVEGSSELSAAAAGSEGDGILMAEEVGADLYEEPWVIGLGVATQIDGTASLGMDWTKVYVNEKGERFTNEEMHYSIATNEIIGQETPWLILDSTEANADIVKVLEANVDSEEVASEDSFEALAEDMGVPVESLVETMDTFNAGVESGEDAMGKNPEYLVAVESAPYYAIKLYPYTMGTFAGVKTNENFQVLDEEGNVIENLYSTGESSNKIIYNQVYMSGSAVQFAPTSGRIAGQHAAEAVDGE